MTLLKINNLSKQYDEKNVVKNLNYSFSTNKCIALIGPNGAGKTTTLRMLAGLIKPSGGEITFIGEETTKDIRTYIGYLPQYPVFPNWMTGQEFLVYCGMLAFLSKEIATTRARHLLKQVGIFDAKDQQIGTYSGGMKQRLGIAQAMIHQPKFLIMDEPVSSLDPIGRREVLTLMETLKKDMTILFATHILSDAEEISDELLLLYEGEIVESGTMDALQKKYMTAKFILNFEANLNGYQTSIDTLPGVLHSYVERNLLHVVVAEIEQSRKEILELVAKENWPLTTFTVHQTSLEEMFMKVVKNECSG